MIDSDGALELHPTLGIADVIVDLTSSGTTLKDNRLREIRGGTVLESASCLIGHAPALAAMVAEGEDGPLALLLDAIDGVRASEGWLHLEVVGEPGRDRARGPRPSPPICAIAGRSTSPGARSGTTATPPAGASPHWSRPRPCPSYRRRLLALGAARVVGLPARFVFDRDAPSTFDRLGKGTS